MTTTLRMLLLTDRYPPQVGGVGMSAARMAGLLTARGVVVHVLHLCADVEPGAVVSEREGDVMVHRLGALATDDLTLQRADSVITHLHARVCFSLFHGHYLTPAGYLAAFYARVCGARSYVSIRGNDLDRGMFDPAQLPFMTWTLQHAHGVGCVSRALAAKCRVLAGRDDIDYMPNAVDTALFRPQPENDSLRRGYAPTGEALLGFVGELRFKKGTHFLLEALRAVRAQRPAKLLLIGGMRGEDKALLRRYLRQYHELRTDIHVIEYLHDPVALVEQYNLLDIVLLPSLWDGMPNSMLEAMACGRVVLASDAGGIPDVIRHGDTGLLIGVHELHRLGEGCLEILTADESLRAAIGARARAYVETHHTPHAEVERLLTRYEEILALS